MLKKKTLYNPDTVTIKLRKDLALIDFSSFWWVFEENRDVLFKVCLKRFSGSVDEAEEALSGVMIKAIEILPNHIKKINNIKSWLISFTNNYCIDLYREKQKIKVDFSNFEEILEDDRVESANFSPEQDNISGSNKSNVAKQIINRVPPVLRDAFIYRCFHEMPYEEISKLLSVSIPTVRKRVQRAREVIQKLINGQSDKNVIKTSPLTISDHCPKFKEDIDRIILNSNGNKLVNEIDFHSSVLHNTQVTLESGVVLDTYIGLNKKPSREEMKENTLKEYIQRFPNGWKKRLELANLLYSVNRWKEASEMYQEVLKRKENLVNVRIGLGEMYHLMEKDDKSVKIYQSAIPFARKTGTIHHVKGLIQMQKKNYCLAIKEFEKSIIEESGHEAHRQRLGMIYTSMDQPEKALLCFNEALEINPKNIIALTHSAEIMMKTGRPVQAINQAEKILDHDNANIPALKMVVDDRCRRRLVFQEEGKKTRQLIKKLKKLGPKVADVSDSLAFYKIVKGQIKNGIAELADFTKKYQNNPRGWYHYGRWLYKMGNTKLAAESIFKAWSLYKNDSDIHKIACKILSHAKLSENLFKVIKDMLDRFDRMWSTWAIAAQAIANINKCEKEAYNYALGAIKLQPDLPETWFQVGFVFEQIKNVNYAKRSFEKGLSRLADGTTLPIAVHAAIKLALYYQKNGSIDICDQYLKKADSMIIPLKISNPSYGFYLLGSLREVQNSRLAAIEAYSKALTYNLFYPLRVEADNARKRLVQ